MLKNRISFYDDIDTCIDINSLEYQIFIIVLKSIDIVTLQVSIERTMGTTTCITTSIILTSLILYTHTFIMCNTCLCEYGVYHTCSKIYFPVIYTK